MLALDVSLFFGLHGATLRDPDAGGVAPYVGRLSAEEAPLEPCLQRMTRYRVGKEERRGDLGKERIDGAARIGARRKRARAKRVGRTERVLVEERRALKKSDPLRGALGVAHAWVGRSMGEAPGVDGGVYFTGEVSPGVFVDVTLRGATAFDFHGVLVPQLVGV